MAPFHFYIVLSPFFSLLTWLEAHQWTDLSQEPYFAFFDFFLLAIFNYINFCSYFYYLFPMLTLDLVFFV